MTDQDPTQRFDAPAPEPVPAVPAAPPPVTFEPPAAGPTPVSTVPVTPAPSGRPGRSKARWLIAAVVTLLVAGTAAGATLLLTGDSGDPDVLSWTPANSVVYGELRLDLPGSQQAELAKVMSAFPGFDDQAAFPTKLNEALDLVVKKATSDKQSYQADIAPWFGGQVAASVGPLPTTADASAVRALVLASVKDGTKASAWAAGLVTDAGATSSTETYNGVTITTVKPAASASGAMAKADLAYATFGPVLALGDAASVKAAIDTKGTSGLATNEQFKTAEASVPGDRLGFGYVDIKAITDGAQALAGTAVTSAMPKIPAVLDGLAAPWGAAAVRAQDGSFIVDTRMPHIAKLGPATSAESKLPSVLPATTVALVEGHDIGQALERIKTLAASDPTIAPTVTQLDDTLKIVGGFGSIVDWMGEAGIAVTRDGSNVGGGVVIMPTDKAAAERLLTQLNGFIQLAGASSGIKVSDESYNGATITTIDLGNLGSLAGGATGGALNIASGLKLVYTVTDQVVAIGLDASFAKQVIDTTPATSLAQNARFSAALSQVDKAHGSLMWLDVAGIRDLLEGQIPAANRAAYDADTKPYLDAFDSVIGTYAPGDPIDRGTLSIHVAAN